jgi:hypothetical protein
MLFAAFFIPPWCGDTYEAKRQGWFVLVIIRYNLVFIRKNIKRKERTNKNAHFGSGFGDIVELGI